MRDEILLWPWLRMGKQVMIRKDNISAPFPLVPRHVTLVTYTSRRTTAPISTEKAVRRDIHLPTYGGGQG